MTINRRSLLHSALALCAVPVTQRASAATAATPAPAKVAASEAASGSPAHGATRFPEGFLWGAATAAYQVEGA